MKTRAIGVLAIMCWACVGPVYGVSIPATEIVADWSRMPSPVSPNDTNNALWSAVDGEVCSDADHSGSKVSDFSTSGNFTFHGTMRAIGDDDTMGVIFGLQDIHNHYRLSFPHDNGSSGHDHAGMVVVRETIASDTYLAWDDSLGWTAGVTYEFWIERDGAFLDVRVDDPAGTIFLATIEDSIYTTGRIGLYVHSQDAAYGDIDCSVPEPGGMVFWVLCGLALAVGRSKFRRRRA